MDRDVPFEVRVEGAVVRVTGELEMRTVPTLEAALEALGDSGIELHLHLGFIDSRGVMAVLRAIEDARSAGRPAVVSSMSQQVRRVVEMAGLAEHLTGGGSNVDGRAHRPR